MAETTNGNRLKTTSMVTLLILFSKIVGFLRESVVAAYFGTGPVTTAYFNSSSLLSYFSLFFTIAISAAFLPIYTKLRVQKGWKDANHYANNVLNIFMIFSVGVCVLAFILAPALSKVMYQGENANVVIPLMIRYSRIMFPTIIFLAMAGVLCNICNANDRFMPEQLQGIALSLCVSVAAIFFQTGESLAIGVAVAGILHLIWILPFLHGIFRYQPVVNLRDNNFQRTMIIAVPSLIALGFDEMNGFISKTIASTLSDAAVSYQTYDYRILMLIQGILIVPIITVMFPQMSRKVANNDKKGMISTITQSTEIMAMITFPIILLVSVFSKELVGLLFQRGRFGAEDTSAVAVALVGYMVGLFGFGMRNFQTRAFFAMQKNKVPLIVGIITVIMDIGLSFLLSHFFGLIGLLLASSISATIGAAVMMVILRRMLGPMGIRSIILEMGKIAIASVAGGAIALLLSKILPFHADTMLHRLLLMGIGGISGLIVYAVGLFLLRARSMYAFLRIIFKKKEKNI